MNNLEQQTLEAARSFFRRSADKEINWEQRRYELAKDAMSALISNPAIFQLNPQVGVLSWRSEKPLAEVAVEIADTVIEKLKQTNNN